MLTLTGLLSRLKALARSDRGYCYRREQESVRQIVDNENIFCSMKVCKLNPEGWNCFG
jgi:hypothetical protein